jgi:hypothetical protein
VCKMIFELLTFLQQAQVVLRALDVKLDAPPGPLVVGMCGYPVAHDLGNDFERLVETLTFLMLTAEASVAIAAASPKSRRESS